MAKAKAKTGNPFLDGDFSNVMDFNKLAEQFKLPGVDSSLLVESQRRNLEAVTMASQVAVAGAQAIVQRQAEIVRQAMDGASKAVRELTTPGEPAETWAKQTELLKETYETSLANMRELAEMGAKSNSEATDLLTHRIAANLDEIKGAFAAPESAK